MPTPPAPRALRAAHSLGDPKLRSAVERFVRRRVPASDVEDVVQTVFVDALAAQECPDGDAELTRWLLGIARHKVVDRHRRATRESPGEIPEIPTSPGPFEARSLASWAEEQAGNEGAAQRTLAWMAREGEGEKLDAIAADEKIPAARVRQRVSRMRRWMKERWAAELAAVAALGVLAVLAWWLVRKPTDRPEAHDVPTVILPDVAPLVPPETVVERAKRANTLRDEAFRACDEADWRGCLDALDGARALDPEGDRDPRVGAARAQANEALAPTPVAPTKTPFTASKEAPDPTTPTPAPSAKPPLATPKSRSVKPSPSDFEDAPSFPKSGSKSGSEKGGEKAGPVRKRASQTVLGDRWSP